MRIFGLILSALTFLTGAASSSTGGIVPTHVNAPDIKVGDAWSFDQTEERGSSTFSERRTEVKVERKLDDTMIVGIKISGAPSEYEDHVIGNDWSMRRVINGQQVITAVAFAFPLIPGKTWTSEYFDSTRHGRQTLARHRLVSKVIGWENVTVPAGTFRVVRIENTDTIEAHLEAIATAGGGVISMPSAATSFAGVQKSPAEVIYQIDRGSFLYSPETKYFVRREEELYNSENIRQEHLVEVLTSFNVSH